MKRPEQLNLGHSIHRLNFKTLEITRHEVIGISHPHTAERVEYEKFIVFFVIDGKVDKETFKKGNPELKISEESYFTDLYEAKRKQKDLGQKRLDQLKNNLKD